MYHHPHRAFTLIELLVVIAIIALLAAMSGAAINTVRDSSKASRCLSNLRQYGMAIICYTNNNDGMLPPGQLGVGGADQVAYRAYDVMGMLIMNDCMETKVVQYSALPTAAMRTIFDCPAARDVDVTSIANHTFCYVASNAFTDTAKGFVWTRYGANGPWVVTTSYTINVVPNGSYAEIPFDELNSSQSRNTTKAMASLKRVSNTALVWDGMNIGINDCIGRIVGRHTNRTRTNVLFVDGHAASHATASSLHPAFANDSITAEASFVMPP